MHTVHTNANGVHEKASPVLNSIVVIYGKQYFGFL